jgi:selenocysteine lyase/cysteine desulfurase
LIADVRLGLSVHAKQSIGATVIEKREKNLSSYLRQRLSANRRLVVLGQASAEVNSVGSAAACLPIISFLIRYNDKFLHFNYVCALLNDLFGIQSRGMPPQKSTQAKLIFVVIGGCMCAGPFAQMLLGMSLETIQAYEDALLDKHEV